MLRKLPPCATQAVSDFVFHNNSTPRRCQTMAKDVLCEVNSCRHWDSGNKCGAETIYIVAHKEAQTSTETDCQTFEMK